jgi:transcriptional regulator
VYLPAHFASEDLAELDALVARDAFATLVTVVDGEPFASHLPVTCHRDGANVRFEGHWARANPQWQHGAEQRALLIIHGAHAHVSPSWYEAPSASVPTWNYAVAHIRGPLHIVDDAASLERIVTELSQKYEPSAGSTWRFADTDAKTQRQLAGIVGFELVAERIEVKRKLSQHHSLGNLRGAFEGLRARGTPADLEIAAMMEAVYEAKRAKAAAEVPA